MEKDFYKTIFSQKKEYKEFKCSKFDRREQIKHMRKWRKYIWYVCYNEKEFSAVWDFFNDGIDYEEMMRRI